MRTQVDRILFNTLARRDSVALPGVGSLLVERQPAQRTSARQMNPPRTLIHYTGEERGIALPHLIAAAGGCSEEEAREIYTRWLEKTREGEVLVIGGVGTIAERRFTIDPQLDKALNPLGKKPLTLRPRCWINPLLAIVVLASLAVTGTLLYLSREPLLRSIHRKETVHTEAICLTEPAQPTECLQPTLPDDSLEVNTPTETLVEPLAEGVTNEQLATPSAAEAATAGTEMPHQEITRTTPGQTYVVAGIYSTEENARRAAGEIATDYPELTPHIYLYGAKWMVSLHEDASAEACQAFITQYTPQINGLWPYTKR